MADNDATLWDVIKKGGADATNTALGILGLGASTWQRKDITSMIAKLPSPTNLQFDFPKEWSPEATGAFSGEGNYDTLGGAAKGGLSGIGALLVSGAMGAISGINSGSGAGLSNQLNKSLNTNEKMLFQTLPFRTIQLDWELIPKSAEEAKGIEEFIKKMKVYTAPNNPMGTAVWDFPDTFSLIIRSKQGNGKYIAFKTPDMACTNLTVNHTPQGFMTGHTDGYPVQTNLSMSFMERVLATKDKLDGKNPVII